MTAKCFADQTYTNADIKAMMNEPISGRVEPQKVVTDITPKSPCESHGSGIAGFGHQETKICPDGATGLQDIQESYKGKVTRWKGNPQIGYYKLREDGSIDTSHWKQRITGVLA